MRRVFRSGKVTKEYTRRLWLAAASGESGANREITSSADVEELIQLLADLSGAIREELLCDLGEPSPPHILSVAQLNRLHRSGIEIGSHGLTHIPIPKSGDIWRELRTSRETLASLLTEPQPQAPTALSFPHAFMILNVCKQRSRPAMKYCLRASPISMGPIIAVRTIAYLGA